MIYIGTEKDKSFYSVRTDLAVEAKDMYVEQAEKSDQVPGVEIKDKVEGDIKINTITISQEGEEVLQKSLEHILPFTLME